MTIRGSSYAIQAGVEVMANVAGSALSWIYAQHDMSLERPNHLRVTS